MNRSILYSQQQIRSFDVLSQEKDALFSTGILANDLLWGNANVAGNATITGFAVSATGTNLTFTLGPGSIYQLATFDGTVFGTLAADSTTITQQGYTASQNITLVTSGLTSGQSQWVLIEAAFSQQDIIRAQDPNSGILPFYNSASPLQPFQGPTNSNNTLNTERQATVTVRVVYGGAALSNPTIPGTDSGYVPLYLVLLAFGQTTVSASQVLQSGYGSTSASALIPLTTGVSRSYGRQNTTVTVSNTVTATALFAATLNANVMQLNSRLRLIGYGAFFNNVGSAQNMTISFNVGATTYFTTGAISLATSATNNNGFAFEWIIDNSHSLTSQNQTCQVDYTTSVNSLGSSMWAPSSLFAVNTSTITTTSNQILYIYATPGSANTLLTASLYAVNVELIP